MVISWIILLLASAKASCVIECNSSSKETCMECLAHKSLLLDSKALCNLWNYSQCHANGIMISSLEDSLELSYNDWKANLALQFYEFSRLTTVNIAFKNSTIADRNCSLELETGKLFKTAVSLPFQHSSEARSIRLWLIGDSSGKNKVFQGFLYLSKTPFFISQIDCIIGNKVHEQEDENIDFYPPWIAPPSSIILSKSEKEAERQLAMSCFTGCTSCLTPSIISCIACAPGLFLFQRTCLTACPTGTSSSKSPSGVEICIKSTNTPIKLEFSQLTEVPTNYEFIKGGVASTSAPWIADRGWYFDGSSYLKFNAMFSSWCNMMFWFSPTASSVADHTPLLYFTNGRYGLELMANGNFYLKGFNLSSKTYKTDGNWKYAETVHYYSSGSQSFKVGLYNRIDGITSACNDAKDCIFNDGNNYHDTLSYKFIGYNNVNYFTGFIYRFIFYLDPNGGSLLTDFLFDNGSCIPNSPYPTPNCLDLCVDTNKYYSSGCLSCTGTPCSHGCTDASSSCHIGCSIADCDICTGKQICGTCKGDLLPLRNTCICPYTYTKTNAACSCPSLKHDHICVVNCPTGTKQSGSDCVADIDNYTSGLVFHLTLNQIKGTVYDSVGNIPVLAGSTTSFYPDAYGANDPIPAYNRGYYFNGNSYMRLPPNDVYPINTSNVLLFPSSLSISAWINAFGGTGTIISKVPTTSGPAFWLWLNSQFLTLYITLATPSEPSASYYVHSNLFTFFKLVLNSWSHISVTLFHDSFATYVDFEVSGKFRSQVGILGVFVDTNDYQAYIGTHRGVNIASSDYNNFNGYIYELKIWNWAADTSGDYSYSCGDSSCIAYPAGGTALATESIDKFHDDATGNSVSCPAACSTTGCRKAGSCNLYESDNCLYSGDWTGCNKCKSDYFLYDDGNKLHCIGCTESCDSCIPSPQCFECGKGVRQAGTSCEIVSYGYQISFENGKIYVDFAAPLSFDLRKDSYQATSEDGKTVYDTSSWVLHKVSNKQYYIDSDLTEDKVPFNFSFDLEML